MKIPSNNSVPTFSIKLISLFVAVFLLHFTEAKHLPDHSYDAGSKEFFWPWDHHNCPPFWPFDCDHDSSTPPPAQPFPPLTSPPPAWTPAFPPTIPPPQSQPPPPWTTAFPPMIPPPQSQPPPPWTPAFPPMIPPPQSQPPPQLPSQLSFSDLRLAVVYPVIQKFKAIITSDPFGVTKTWVGSDICNYKGFFCDTPPDNASATAIASIDFNGYGLTAPTLDGFIDQLPDLALFHANSNNFGGNVSPNIAKLRYLYELDLSNNKLAGLFPEIVVGMDSLTFLDIRFNRFTGSVPPAMFTQNLDVLFLNDNSFVSTLPDTIGSTHILYLTLADNKLTGPIPRDIAKALSALTEVLLLNNQLTGCLPYELGFLKKVTVFDISNNQLIGPLPFSLACLRNIEVLDFSSNLLYGMVPDMICQLPNLGKLSLSSNYFTLVGPFCRNLIRRGVLDVSNNCIPGLPSQRSIFECTSFFAVPRICPFSETFKMIPCKPRFP